MIDKLDGVVTKPNSSIKAGQTSDQGTGSIRLRSGLTLTELQCMLDENGATDLVIDLIIGEPSNSVFLECLHLAIALLEGGNGTVQVSASFSEVCLCVRACFKSNLFFKHFSDKFIVY